MIDAALKERRESVAVDVGGVTVCGGAPGCVRPLAFSLPSTGGFNGGYYDTVGRRYFVGLQMQF